MYNLLRKKNVALSERFKPRISTFINRADGEFEVLLVGISYFLCVGMWDLKRKEERESHSLSSELTMHCTYISSDFPIYMFIGFLH